jgi:hypothetical protein
METPTFKCFIEFYSIDGVTEVGTIISQKQYWRYSAIERRFFKVQHEAAQVGE